MIHSYETEVQFIARLLQNDTNKLEEINDQYFYNKELQSIYKTIKKLHAQGQDIDLISVANFHNPARVVEISTSFFPGSVDNEIKILTEHYKRRTAISLLEQASAKLQDRTNDIDSILSDVAQGIDNANKSNKQDDSDSPTEILSNLYASLRSAPDPNETDKYYWGIRQLDYLTNGLQKGEVTTIAAKSGVGKTAFALQVAARLGQKGLRVLVFSREMTSESIYKRIIISATKIDGIKFRKKSFTTDEWAKIDKTVDYYQHKQIYVNSTASTVTEMKKRIRQLQPDVVIIDYLQLLTPEQSLGNREREVATISRAIRNISSDYQIPILQLSQLNEEEGESKPTQRSLRESKAIYHDSSNVIFIHEPSKKELDKLIDIGKVTEAQVKGIENRENKLVLVILDKQRDGETGFGIMEYIKKELKFAELTPFEDGRL